MISQEVAALDAPELMKMAEELKAARTAYDGDVELLHRTTDPETARLLARGIVRSVIADAKEIRWKAGRAEAEKKRADEGARLRQRKLAAGATTSSTATQPVRPRPKTADEMSRDEINAALAHLG